MTVITSPVKLTAGVHRVLVGASPLVLGLSATLLQALYVHEFDPWVLGTAAVTGLTTIYLNIVRGNTPTTP